MDGDKSSLRKRKGVNADEKARQRFDVCFLRALVVFKIVISRDRNREHAKNTRLRKKAFVTKLQQLLDEMVINKKSEESARLEMGKSLFDQVRISRFASL